MNKKSEPVVVLLLCMVMIVVHSVVPAMALHDHDTSGVPAPSALEHSHADGHQEQSCIYHQHDSDLSCCGWCITSAVDSVYMLSAAVRNCCTEAAKLKAQTLPERMFHPPRLA